MDDSLSTKSGTISQDELKKYLKYDPETGVFTTLKNKPVGYTTKRGYTIIQIAGKKYYAHRLAWLYVFGPHTKWPIDHINHNRSDNRISNLRSVSDRDNVIHSNFRKTNTSGITGVHFNKNAGKWESQIMVDGNQIYIGLYSKMADAISARKNAEEQYWNKKTA